MRINALTLSYISSSKLHNYIMLICGVKCKSVSKSIYDYYELLNHSSNHFHSSIILNTKLQNLEQHRFYITITISSNKLLLYNMKIYALVHNVMIWLFYDLPNEFFDYIKKIYNQNILY